MPVRSLVVLLLLVCGTAHAKRFRNAYVSFELPPNWNCKLEGSEWVCENEFAGKTKEAIIILTAKEVGPTDTLASYRAHLQTPRALPGRGGQPLKSQVIHVKERMVSNQMWIDGMHLGSEVGPYFTRYLATIKDRIAILITFSAHKEHYTKYSGDFIKAVDSLRVVATKDSLGDRAANGPSVATGDERLGGPIGPGSAISPYINDSLPQEAPPAKGGLLNWLIAAVMLAAVGGYIYLKMGKKPKKKISSKPNSKPPGSKPPTPNSPSSRPSSKSGQAKK